MSTNTNQTPQSPTSSTINSLTTLPQTKNNLIQNFYVIGFSHEEFFSINPKTKKGEFINIFTENPEEVELTPKLISKFPPIPNKINNIEDNIIVNHCFPKGLKITNKYDESNGPSHFQFELNNNIPCKYSDDENEIYSKIYFTCLEIYEPVSLFLKYKKNIINCLLKTKTIELDENAAKEKITADLEKKFSKYYLTKVICFSSILPFYAELSKLLDVIYDNYLTNINQSTPFPIPLEKLLEQFIFNIPLPIKDLTQFSVEYKDAKKDKLITSFILNNIEEACLKYNYNMSMQDIFLIFSVDDIIKIYKYIFLEIPLLIFSENKSILSVFVENFISLLSPLNYVYPFVSILPSSLYGLINLEKKFIFGINQNYNANFFEENNINLNKSVVIVSIDLNNKQTKIEEKIKKNNDDDSDKILINNNSENNNENEEYTILNDNKILTISIDFPPYEKKKLHGKITNYLSFIKRKNFFTKKSSVGEFSNYKIQNIFEKFLIYIMIGYSDFLLYSQYFNENQKNSGENIIFKSDRKNFVKEVFNLEEFFKKTPKENHPFYTAFFNTKMFYSFLHDKIYSNNPITILKFRQFDQLIYIKKHKEFRKKEENKAIYESFHNDTTPKITAKENVIIPIDTSKAFDDKQTIQLLNNEKTIKLLINYGQSVQMKTSNSNSSTPEIIPYMSYLFFPKLLFDDKFFKEKYIDIISKRGLVFPSNENLNIFKLQCKTLKEKCEEKRKYMFTEELFKKLTKTNKSGINYEIKYMNYINYIWLILFSASLFHCQKNERNVRITKVFEILNKIEYIEEYVLDILLYNIYKYCSKYNFIKLFKICYKFNGYSNYYLLNLLCNKIQENEENITNSMDNSEDFDEDYTLPKRTLICNYRNFFESMKEKMYENNKDLDVITENNEQIIFSTEQKCDKCKKKFDINPLVKLQKNIDPKDQIFKCKKTQCNCKTEEEKEIKINYQILLTNFAKKHSFVINEGEFLYYTPYKLYIDLKNYLINENIEKIDVENIFSLENKINLINIFFYFSLLNLPFDFILPYANSKKKENNSNENVPIIISFADDVTLRKFTGLTPVYNPKKKFFKRTSTDMSFTVKNNKTKMFNKTKTSYKMKVKK